ncbi:hypothetical protein GE061_008925 [Apolygus lucorum]|uniref:Peptidase M48 domain-containing protein n=1 Tax=Apolygus lucorum TaxID=248454 RepID=A0A6A4K9A2_APOLU|nr:hypothetical protein GE061_008925 [Apolygus lucorum]
MSDGYAPLIWSYTSYYSGNIDTRAVIYSAMEDFTSKMIVVPIIVLFSLFQQGLKISPLAIALAGIVWLTGSAITSGLRTAILVRSTNRYGTDFFIYLGFIYEAAIVIGHIVFIQILAPFMLHDIPEGPAKSTIDGVAQKAGYYPRHVVYFEPNAEGRPDADPNAYHAGLLGASMIVVAESLLKIVGPTDIGAVVAHELGHWSYSHSSFSFATNALANACFMLTSMWSYGNREIYDIFSFNQNDPPHPIIGVLLSSKYFFPILGGFLTGFRGSLSYFCEFAADGFAVKMGLGTELRRSLINLTSRIKMFPGVDPWYAAWFRGHPSLVLRIEKLS